MEVYTVGTLTIEVIDRETGRIKIDDGVGGNVGEVFVSSLGKALNRIGLVQGHGRISSAEIRIQNLDDSTNTTNVALKAGDSSTLTLQVDNSVLEDLPVSPRVFADTLRNLIGV